MKVVLLKAEVEELVTQVNVVVVRNYNYSQSFQIYPNEFAFAKLPKIIVLNFHQFGQMAYFEILRTVKLFRELNINF